MRFLLALCLAGAISAQAAERDWQPARTWVYIVGVLEWKHNKMWPSFPTEGRRDSVLANWFKSSGVPENQIVLLQDDAATAAAIRGGLRDFAAKSAKGDTIFVYYAGHGYREPADGVVYFAPFDAFNDLQKTCWPVPEIFATLEQRFNGARAIIAADCCHSGSLADIATALHGRIAYSTLCSSPTFAISTESWTFSDSLLDALSGAPQVDRNGDGAVSIEEAGMYLRREMVFFERQPSVSALAGSFKPEWCLAPASGPKPHARIGEHVEVVNGDDARKALIVGAKDAQFQVRFAATKARNEAWVEAASIRPAKEPSEPDYSWIKVGGKVRVEWKRAWFPATVVAIDGVKKKYHISYDGYDVTDNEWVNANRVRPPKKKKKAPAQQ